MHTIFDTLGNIGLIPVIKLDSADKADALSNALRTGGLPCAEITFRTDAAADAIRAMRKNSPDILTGAGTVVNTVLAEKAIDAGAQFIVSPGFNPSVVDYCLSRGVPIIPGINNASGIEAGLEKGLDVFKFFPAELSGGTAMLGAFAGPFERVRFVPTGGIDAQNLAGYMKADNVLAVGGSWMVPASLIAQQDWNTVTALCREAAMTVHGFRFAHVGINNSDEAAAAETARAFSLFALPFQEGTSSIFSGKQIEVMKSPMRGHHGHIAISCWNVERALAYLKPLGFSGVAETAKYEKGKCTVIYLDKEIGGFAVHLVKGK